MLKKTKIITNIYWIVNSTYTVSYTDRCTSCSISIDHTCGAALDNWKGGGDYAKNEIITLPRTPPPPKRSFFSIKEKKREKTQTY